MTAVALHPLTEDTLPALLDAAVAGADPLEVMPPVDGGAGWTEERRAAFLAFHRARSLAERPREATFVVVVDGRIAGAARLEPVGAGELETGVWLSRDARGRGVGRAVTALLRDEAVRAGARRIVATTTPQNLAARALLAGEGGRVRVADDEVHGAWEL